MKNCALILFVFFLGLHELHSQEQAKELESEIKQVTVFLSGAELQHFTTTSIASGKQQINLIGLSPEMDANSVAVEIEPHQVTMLSVTSKTNYLKPVKENKRIVTVRDSIQILQDKAALVSFEIQTLEKERDLLFKNEAIGGVTQGVAIAEIEKAADFFRNRTNSINQKLFALKKEQDVLNYQLSQYRQQLDELNARHNPPTSEVMIELVSPQAQECKITLKYLVRTAGWDPKYDVRAESVNEDVKLVYRARVFNGSGIDWKNVNINLSTATPMLGAEKPELEKWVLNASPTKLASISQVTISAGASNGYFNNDSKPKADTRTIEVQELNTEFKIAIPYTILADKKPYTVDVTDFKLPAIYEYYAAPKEDRDAFLTAKVVGWNNLNLVSGNASVYFAGTYLGQSFINTASTSDTLTLSLGRDRLMTIQRQQESELSKHQFIGNNEKETFYFKTIVRNNHDKAITITIEDQIPVSTTGEIVVDALQYEGGSLESNTGKITWRLTLNPGEMKEIRLGYSIKSPKGMIMEKRKFRSVAAPSF